jgi:methyl-accepting chemotaxis protein
MKRGTAVACAFALLAGGCATRGSVRQVGEDLRGLQGEVGALRQSQEDLSRRLAETASVNRAAQPRTNQLAASIAGVKADVERLTAKVQATDAPAAEEARVLLAGKKSPSPSARRH